MSMVFGDLEAAILNGPRTTTLSPNLTLKLSPSKTSACSFASGSSLSYLSPKTPRSLELFFVLLVRSVVRDHSSREADRYHRVRELADHLEHLTRRENDAGRWERTASLEGVNRAGETLTHGDGNVNGLVGSSRKRKWRSSVPETSCASAFTSATSTTT